MANITTDQDKGQGYKEWDMTRESIHPIHFVRAWSGKESDESPVCGADKSAPTVWGYRTHFVRGVTCEQCLALIRPLTADERDGGARFEAAQNAGLDY